MSKIYEFENIEPKEVLKWFKKICSIPHGSYKENKLAVALKADLEKAGCEIQMLSSGAMFAKQKATFGHDNWPAVLLQGHMDMVQVKDDGVEIDFDNEPIKAYYDTEKCWLKADGTTLGADNGVALAMFMEVLTNPKIEHGPLEVLFTIGEEVDPSICMNSIPNNLMDAKYYINLDSDHDNTIFYASAGVYKVTYNLPLNFKDADPNMETYEIDLQKFSGGHSALIIHNPHVNPIIFACKTLLHYAFDNNPIRLVSIDGGVANNAIPTWARIVIQLNKNDLVDFEKYFKEAFEIAKVTGQGFEDDAQFNIKKIENANKSLDTKETYNIFKFYAFVPNDMFMTNHIGKCMFNSSNVGLVRTAGNNIVSGFYPRSFYKPDLEKIAKSLAIYSKEHGATDIHVSQSCACWLTQDVEGSRIINLWKENYIKVVGEEPFILPNPGGLEVAEIVTKNKKMMPNAMSTGPIIFKEHSTFENCPVESIKKIWKILQLTLKGLDK